MADQQAATAGILAALDVTAPVSLTADPRERAALWSIRKGLYTSVAGARPSGTTALLEDVVVPVPALLDTCQSLLELFDRHSYKESVIFGHAKDGNIHFMLNESFEDPANLERYQRFTEDMVDVVLGNHGSLKAEHGTGRIMAPFVRRQYGDELHDVMCRIKTLFDPHGILSPGVVLSDDPTSYVRDLKQAPDGRAGGRPLRRVRLLRAVLPEPAPHADSPAADRPAPGAGQCPCRRQPPAGRRAGGRLRLRGARHLCRDGMCQVACPVEINTGDLVRRLRAERVGPVQNALWDSAARRWAPVTKGAGAALTVAGTLPAHGRRRDPAGPPCPRPRQSPAVRRGAAPRRRGAGRWSAPDADAVFFPACIGTMFGPAPDDPGVSTAFLRLCERAGVTVRVPQEIVSTVLRHAVEVQGARSWPRPDDRAGAAGAVDGDRRGAAAGGVRRVVLHRGAGDDAPAGGRPVRQVVRAAVRRRCRVRRGAAAARLTVTAPLGSLALHHTCSSTQLGTNAAAAVVAAAIAGR